MYYCLDAPAMRSSSCSRWSSLYCGLALYALSGCGLGTGEVTGSVKYQGKIVAGGSVIIRGSDRLPYSGTINEDGTYRVLNVPTGPATITVHSPGPAADIDPGADVRLLLRKSKKSFTTPPKPALFAGDRDKWFRLPDKYQEFDQSGLTLTVKAGVNEHDLRLE
jgi:hypothetical protein